MTKIERFSHVKHQIIKQNKDLTNAKLYSFQQMSTWEKKIMMIGHWLLAENRGKAREEDVTSFEISVSEVAKLITESTSHVYEDGRINEVIRSLSQKKLLTHYQNTDTDKHWEVINIFQSAKRDNERIILNFTPMYAAIVNDYTNNHTQYYLETAMRLNTFASLTIFELCSQWREYLKEGKAVELTYTAEEVRDLLGLYDIVASKKVYKYPMSGNLKQKVLDPSEKAIFEKTDFQIKWLPAKYENRKLVKYKLIIRLKSGATTEQASTDPEILSIRELGVGPTVLRRMRALEGDELVLAAVRRMKNIIQKSGIESINSNPNGYFKKVIASLKIGIDEKNRKKRIAEENQRIAEEQLSFLSADNSNERPDEDIQGPLPRTELLKSIINGRA